MPAGEEPGEVDSEEKRKCRVGVDVGMDGMEPLGSARRELSFEG